MARNAGEISELAQNRLAIGVRCSANACEETPLHWCCAVRSTINCISCRHQA
ncbi:hypothetical protein ACLK1S_13855 [Escherichia coli]